MPSNRYVKIRVIDTTERLVLSNSGNPRFRVFFTNGDVILTQSDATCNHGLDGAAMQGVALRITLSRTGRITHAAKAEKFYRVHVHDHSQGRWLAQADFAERPVPAELPAELPILTQRPGRYEVQVHIVRCGEETAGWSWLQNGPEPAAKTH